MIHIVEMGCVGWKDSELPGYSVVGVLGTVELIKRV